MPPPFSSLLTKHYIYDNQTSFFFIICLPRGFAHCLDRLLKMIFGDDLRFIVHDMESQIDNLDGGNGESGQ